MACSPAGKPFRSRRMFTPAAAGESSAVPTLLPIPSCISTLTAFCAAAEKAVEITSATVIAIVLCSLIGCAVYPNPSELFALKILRVYELKWRRLQPVGFGTCKDKPPQAEACATFQLYPFDVIVSGTAS